MIVGDTSPPIVSHSYLLSFIGIIRGQFRCGAGDSVQRLKHMEWCERRRVIMKAFYTSLPAIPFRRGRIGIAVAQNYDNVRFSLAPIVHVSLCLSPSRHFIGGCCGSANHTGMLNNAVDISPPAMGSLVLGGVIHPAPGRRGWSMMVRLAEQPRLSLISCDVAVLLGVFNMMSLLAREGLDSSFLSWSSAHGLTIAKLLLLLFEKPDAIHNVQNYHRSSYRLRRITMKIAGAHHGTITTRTCGLLIGWRDVYAAHALI